MSADRAQHTYAIVEKEGQRSPGRAWDDTAVNRPLRRRPTPRGVSANVVRRGDSPQVLAVAGELVVKRKAEQLVRLGGLHRILEVIRVSVSFIAEVIPRLRVLMRKQRIIARDVVDTLIGDFRPCPRIPCAGRDWMGR